MREPAFWYGRPSFLSWLLQPISAIYGIVAANRLSKRGLRAAVPVICVGNYHVGGAGKTPVTLAVSNLLSEMGERPFVVSRGYGGKLTGPILVTADHWASDVGDEPLMMSAHVSVIVAKDRAAGVAAAIAHGSSVIVLDDGFQNPSVEKDASLIVVDSNRGLGNGRVFPSGPLRAPLPPQLARTDALIVIGDGRAANSLIETIVARGGLVLRSKLIPDEASLGNLRDKRVLAFAGIGDPSRFFATLRANGVDVVQERAFQDHHPFTTEDVSALTAEAKASSLALVTTEKDMARLASDPALAELAPTILTFAVKLNFDDEDALRVFLAHRLSL